MKQLIFTLSLVVTLMGCDKVECPYPEDYTGGPNGSGEPYIGTLITNSVIAAGDATPSTQRNILLEDYTGYKCTNCPEAHEIADDIRASFGEQVSILAMHVSESFAAPNPGAVFPEPFSQDFRTVDGEIYFGQFGIFALPSGLINRLSFNGFFPVSFDIWESTIDEMVDDLADVKLDIQSVAFANDTLSIDATFEFLEDLDGEYFYTACLVENEIISAQDNQGTIVLDYLQKDVFRGTLNGTYGELLASDPQDLNLFTVAGHYYLPGSLDNPTTPNPDIEIEDCHVVIYVYKSDFDNDVFEVIQVGQKEVSL